MAINKFRILIFLSFFLHSFFVLSAMEESENISLWMEEALLAYSQEEYLVCQELTVKILGNEPDNPVALRLNELLKEKLAESGDEEFRPKEKEPSPVISEGKPIPEFVYTKDREKEEKTAQKERYFSFEFNPLHEFLLIDEGNESETQIPFFQALVPVVDMGIDYWLENFNRRVGLYSELILPLSMFQTSGFERQLNGGLNAGVQASVGMLNAGSVQSKASIGLGLAILYDTNEDRESEMIQGTHLDIDVIIPVSSYLSGNIQKTGLELGAQVDIVFFSNEYQRTRYSYGAYFIYQANYWNAGIRASYLYNSQTESGEERLIRAGIVSGFSF